MSDKSISFHRFKVKKIVLFSEIQNFNFFYPNVQFFHKIKLFLFTFFGIDENCNDKKEPRFGKVWTTNVYNYEIILILFLFQSFNH